MDCSQDEAPGETILTFQQIEHFNKKATDDRHMRALNTQRNSYLRINRLPVEVLLDIFAYCVNISVSPGGFSLRRTENSHSETGIISKSIAFSQVCSLWRTIALSSPSLWSEIHDFPFKWLCEVLVRSKELPLTISNLGLLTEPREWPTVMNELEKHAGRVRAWNIRAVSPIASHHQSAAFQQPAPLLERFVVRGNRYIQGRLLPPDLFSGVAPRLLVVVLDQCVPNWIRLASCSCFQNVTDFKYTLRGNWREGIHPTIGLVQVLATMTRLRTLGYAIYSALPNDSGTFNETRVVLPHLRNVYIRGKIDSVVYFMERVSWPLSGTLSVVADGYDDSQETSHIHAVVTEISKRCEALDKAFGIRNLSLMEKTFLFVRLGNKRPSEIPDSTITVEFRVAFEMFSVAAGAFIEALSPSLTHINDIVVCTDIDKDRWIPHIRESPLRLVDTSTEWQATLDFLEALANDIPELGYPPWPNLEELHICLSSPQDIQSIERLCNILQERYQREAPKLKTLEIYFDSLSGCLSEPCMSRLKELAVNIVFY